MKTKVVQHVPRINISQHKSQTQTKTHRFPAFVMLTFFLNIQAFDTWHLMYDMLFVKCLCWSSGHAEQLLFSCVCSKVSICNYVTCRMSHVTCLMSNAYVDPWDMMNNFCVHVYAQMSLYMGENVNAFFWQHKQWLLSLDMKTKLVQHVESDWMRDWESVRVRECESESVREWECDLVPSFCLTFRHFLSPTL